MVQETQAERFREFLVEALQTGTQGTAKRAWKKGWEPSDDIVFDVLYTNQTKKDFETQSDALRESLVKVLLSDPDSEERDQAWKASEQVQSDINGFLAAIRQKEDEYGEPIFADQRQRLLSSDNGRAEPENDDDVADGPQQDVSFEMPGSDLTRAETQIVGELLSSWNQSAVLCDHVNVCTANAMALQKRRLMLITDYRISFCRTISKLNRPPVATTIFLLDVIRVEVDDEFNIIRVIARDDDFYIFARSSSQLKVIMEALAKQFSLVLVGYPSSERVQMPASYPLAHNHDFSRYDAIKRTFEALVDRSGMMLDDFLRCVETCFEFDRKVINLKEMIASQLDHRTVYAALLVACQALRYNCSEFVELIASYIPLGDTGMHAVAKLFTPSSEFASVDISSTGCSQKAMQILSEGIKRASTPYLRCLNVSENSIGNAGIATLLAALNLADIRLEVLACRKCGLSQKGFDDLGAYMTEAKSLKVIDYSSNMPGKSGLDPLFEGLMACQNIERIYLSSCGASARIAPVLRCLVQNNPPKLKTLDLSSNRLTLEDAIQLSNLIKATESLYEISLAHCKIRQDVSNSIVDAIASNRVPHLQFVLDFSRNFRHPTDGSVWPLAIQTLTFPNDSGNLYALNLSECKLSPDEFVSICEHLKSVNPLTVLSLNGCIKTGLFNREACVKAGTAIAELVNVKPSLKILSLSGTKTGMLGSAGINPVLEALVKNTSLCCLIISSNNLARSSYCILRRLLGINTSLQYLAVDCNRASLSSLWQLTGGFIASRTLCSNIPRNDFIDCIVSEKSRDLVEILSSAAARRFEHNMKRNMASFRSLETLISSMSWIPRPRLFTSPTNKNNIDDINLDLDFPPFYHELNQIHLYECGIPFILTWLGDRARRNGVRTKNIFGLNEHSAKYQRALDSFYHGRLELITDVQCCALLITEYLRNRQPLILSGFTCDQMNSGVSSGTTSILLESEIHAQERSILFWLCDLLCDILKASEHNGAELHSLAILFTPYLYPIESWLDNEFEKYQLTVPLFIESCVKLRLQ